MNADITYSFRKSCVISVRKSSIDIESPIGLSRRSGSTAFAVVKYSNESVLAGSRKIFLKILKRIGYDTGDMLSWSKIKDVSVEDIVFWSIAFEIPENALKNSCIEVDFTFLCNIFSKTELIRFFVVEKAVLECNRQTMSIFGNT